MKEMNNVRCVVNAKLPKTTSSTFNSNHQWPTIRQRHSPGFLIGQLVQSTSDPKDLKECLYKEKSKVRKRISQ
jgi:hypothetical protein